MTTRPRLMLATFVFALASAAATLVATTRIAEARAPERPAGARLREAPALTPMATVRALFIDRHYARAYGLYAGLADAGDPEAASMALTMVMHGPALFGSDWSATDAQLQRWSALAQQFVLQRGATITAADRGE